MVGWHLPFAAGRIVGLTEAEFAERAEARGWMSAAERAALPERLRREADDPASFNGSSYAEVLARKPGAGD
jgi:hypothetical protein